MWLPRAAELTRQLPLRRPKPRLLAVTMLGLSSGSVLAHHYRRHRHQEFLRFLKLIDAAVPKNLDLHLVLDNYATHKTPAVKAWLLKHPRFHLHFTPTSSSWLNLVERWSAEPGDTRLHRLERRVDTPDGKAATGHPHGTVRELGTTPSPVTSSRNTLLHGTVPIMLFAATFPV